jgi:aminodeoxyfutalosine deaminase
MIYRARFLVTMEGPPIPWGWMRVGGDQVVAVGGPERPVLLPGESVKEFPDAVLMPGLINAHCHLELGMIRGLMPFGDTFPIWVSRLRKALDGADPDRFRQAARLGALECLKNGTTTVVDVGNTGESLRELAALPIRSFAYLELIGLDPALAESRFRQAVECLAGLPAPSLRYHPGLTCHAPYSCSADLLRKVQEAHHKGGPGDNHKGGPFTLHVSESVEEHAMFRERKGALWEYCRRIYPALSLEACTGAIGHLGRLGLIPRGSLFAHCNQADDGDIGMLAETETSVVHCPKSRAFFNHPHLPMGRLREAGVNLCLGTDSLASNDGLNLFDEMAECKRVHPELPCRDIVAMATVNGARALGRAGELGCLRPGSQADFIALALRHHPGYDLFEEIVREEHEVVLVAIAGEEVVA